MVNSGQLDRRALSSRTRATDTGAINDGAAPLERRSSRPSSAARILAAATTPVRYSGLFGTVLRRSRRRARAPRGAQLRRTRRTSGGDAIQYIDTRSDNLQTGGFGLIQDKTFKRDPTHGFWHGVSWPPRDQGRLRVQRGPAPTSSSGCRAASRSRYSTIRTNAALPVYSALLLDHPDARPAGQRPDLAAERQRRPQDPDRSTCRTAGRVLPNLTVNAGRALGQPADLRRGGGTTQINLDRRTGRRGSGSSGDPTRTTRRRCSARSATTTSRSRWTWSSARYSFERQPTIYNFDPDVHRAGPDAADRRRRRCVAGRRARSSAGSTSPDRPGI